MEVDDGREAAESVSGVACPQCGKTYSCTNSLRTHIKYVHADSLDPVECEECGKSFAHQNSLRTHKWVSHGKGSKPMKCPDCGEMLPKTTMYYHHRRTKHPNSTRKLSDIRAEEVESEPPAATPEEDGDPPCAEDIKEEVAEGIQARVKALVEEMEANVICEECGKRYADEVKLKAHMWVHGDKAVPESCTVCGKTYAHRKSLRQHMKRIHGMKLPGKRRRSMPEANNVIQEEKTINVGRKRSLGDTSDTSTESEELLATLQTQSSQDDVEYDIDEYLRREKEVLDTIYGLKRQKVAE